MTSTVDGQATRTPVNESEHYARGETWLRDAEAYYRRVPMPLDAEDCQRIAVMQKFAELHFLAATAADIDREANAEDRIASCVPDGLGSLNVSVRGQR